MTESLAWIVGRGGFLGRRVRALLSRGRSGISEWSPVPEAFSWPDPPRLDQELDRATRAFGDEVLRRRIPWSVLWCAGAGGIGAPSEALKTEMRALSETVRLLSERLVDRDPGLRGVFVLSSSAGGVYGSSPDLPLGEESPCRPVSDYGRGKVVQEEEVLRFARSRPNVSCLVARISNLYGPGQDLSRSVGLISHLSRSLVHRQPLHVFVPLDTLRDYLYVDDAAHQILAGLDRLLQSDRPRQVVKIVAAGRSISIAGLIGLFAHLVKRAPKIVCAGHPLRDQQPRRLQFRSDVWTDLPVPAPTGLLEGIHLVFRHHSDLYLRGRLAPPAWR